MVVPIWVGAASALAAGIYLGLRALAASRPGLNGGPQAVIDPLDVIKTTITVAGFFGAILVGIYGYRKHRIAEGDAHRADAEQLAQRYTTAAEALGHEKAAVRLAGVYAMARLADDWDDQRQVCINVLCAYLRMPYEPDATSEKHREGEREVRLTIIRIIRDHLQEPDPKLNPNALTTWCGLDFDFTNARFDGGEFSDAKFTGGKVSFEGATFSGGDVLFGGAEFRGGVIIFGDAEFTGGRVSFRYAKFTGGKVYFESAKFASEIFFEGAEFIGGTVSFRYAEFADGEVSFRYVEFADGGVLFRGTKFTGGTVLFDNAKFTGCTVNFGEAEFTGSTVSFSETMFTGGKISFYCAIYTGGEVSFDSAEFTSGSRRIAWGPFEPPAAWTALHGGSGDGA